MEVTDDHEEHVHIRWQSFGVVPGLSEADFMARQRYLQLIRRSGAQYSMLSLGSFQDASKRRPSTSIDVSHFIKEQRKILKTVRSQPWPMHIKINAVRHYKAAISRYTTLLDKFDTVKDTTMQVKSKVNRFYIGLLKTLTIWNSIIKRIEGKFGSSVASYFTFLRWLCALNLFLSFVLIFFVILPQAFSGHGLKVPQEIKQNSSEVSFLFDGQGYILQYSVLFYGYYDSGQNEPYMPPPVNPDPYIGWRYKLPLAYLLMIPLIFGISIVAILMSIAEKYKLIQQADATDPYPFSRRVFTGWDYAVTYANTACRKAAHIATELKVSFVAKVPYLMPQVLSDAYILFYSMMDKEIVADVVSDEQKVLSMKIFAIRILSNGTIIFLLCLSSVAIYVAVENVEKGGNYNFKTALQQGISGLWAFILSFQVQLVIVGRNVTMRGVFLLVAVIERHHPRTALKLMLVRMFCLYVSSLYVLIIALLTISDDCFYFMALAVDIINKRGPSNEMCRQLLPKKTKADDVSGEVCCWETIVGQEMYKLSWTQIGAEILSIFFIDGTVWIVTLCGPQKVKKYVECLEFDIAHHVLQSIYSQALVWLGMLFCPFLPTINFFKCVVLFYIKLFGIMLFNRPPKAMFKISTTNNFYMGMLLLMLFLSLFPVGYAVLEIIPSTECGPFRGQTKMMDVIINEIHTWPDIVQDAIQYIQTSAVIVPLIILLCIIIYYYGALSHVLKELNKDLQVQLILERREVRARIAERLPHNDILPVHSEKFLDTQTRDFSLEHMDDSLSITSFDTYTKYEPKVLAQNIFDDAKHPEDNNLSMYPMISHTDDDDDDDNEDISYIECDQDHASTFTLSSYQQQHTCGKINCCHPTKYSRK